MGPGQAGLQRHLRSSGRPQKCDLSATCISLLLHDAEIFLGMDPGPPHPDILRESLQTHRSRTTAQRAGAGRQREGQ